MLLPGSRVCALVAGGGYAEYCVAPVGTCLPVPEILTLTQAAAMPETLFTVWVNLFERGYAADGDAVLIHGGTSGIGTMAIALGAIFGLKVIVTCGSDEKCDRAADLGAMLAINYKTQDFVQEVREATAGRGVAVVLDMVGGVDRLSPRRQGRACDPANHAATADADRIDASAALDRVQDDGSRRDCADRLALRGRRPFEACHG
jgi:NADPH:quinone reductase-like Zn-dependent oxidoreductase